MTAKRCADSDKKYTEVDGLPVVASEEVADEAR